MKELVDSFHRLNGSEVVPLVLSFFSSSEKVWICLTKVGYSFSVPFFVVVVFLFCRFVCQEEKHNLSIHLSWRG